LYTLSVGVFAGPSLPKVTYGAAMLPTPDATGVVHIGGWLESEESSSRDTYELKCSEIATCNWSIMESTSLSVVRYYHVAMYVPDSFVNCRVLK
jgi:hypothetical protein